jgi:hypothetical protein
MMCMAEKSVDMKGKAVKLKGLVEYQKGSV